MKEKQSSNEFSLMIMTAFFIMSFLLLVIFGTGIYRNIAVSQEESSLSRTLSSYLHTASKMNEAGIYSEVKEGHEVLVVKDGDTGYGNRIYLLDGYLVEDFGRLDDELHTASALKIAQTAVFEIKELSETLLKVTTSDGNVFISRVKGEGDE
ncbi:MAG: DUF4860 domain-containing protein [Erysipelotrichaceae bacterium]|nr:DUF4860 domain-containing protein [Erysipelotrichaceae bacterium]